MQRTNRTEPASDFALSESVSQFEAHRLPSVIPDQDQFASQNFWRALEKGGNVRLD